MLHNGDCPPQTMRHALQLRLETVARKERQHSTPQSDEFAPAQRSGVWIAVMAQPQFCAVHGAVVGTAGALVQKELDRLASGSDNPDDPDSPKKMPVVAGQGRPGQRLPQAARACLLRGSGRSSRAVEISRVSAS